MTHTRHNKAPIGIFDSGLGGLTVLNEVHKRLPSENLIYVGDTARVPYGNKSKATVERYSLQISRFLVERGVKMIVVACNSASSLGIDAVKKEIELPVLGVIEPGSGTALRKTRNNCIGVIGTRGTITSGAYQKALKRSKNGIKVFASPTPLLVPLVEEGWIDNEITRSVLKEYLFPLRDEGIDTLILGCTHYPFLKDSINQVINNDIILVDSAEALAKEAEDVINNEGLTNTATEKGNVQYFTTDSPGTFIEIGSRLLELDLSKTEQVIFD